MAFVFQSVLDNIKLFKTPSAQEAAGNHVASIIGYIDPLVKVKVKRLSANAILPSKAYPNDACFDLSSPVEQDIAPGATAVIPLGFATEIPDGWYACIYARSGLATKLGVRPANCVGVIDSGYRGEWKIALHNDSQEFVNIEQGQRIAQFVLNIVPTVALVEVDELNDSARGEGGFGSTGA